MSTETITKQQIAVVGLIILMLIVAIYFLMRLLKNFPEEYFDITGVNNRIIKTRSTNFNNYVNNGTECNTNVNNGTECNTNVNNGTECNTNVNNGTECNTNINNGTECNTNINNGTECNTNVYESKNGDNRKKENYGTAFRFHKDIECNNIGDKENKLAAVRNNENSAYISYKESESKRGADKAYTVNCTNSLDTQRNIKSEILKFFNYEDEFIKTNTTIMEQQNPSINSFSGVKEGIPEEKILLQGDDRIKAPL